jgi:hypothetical protein
MSRSSTTRCPQFYLSGFATDSERITTVRLPGDKRYTSRIKNNAATKLFYSIDGHPDGTDVFEKALSQLEGGTASVLRVIDGDEWPLSEKQRITCRQLTVRNSGSHTAGGQNGVMV